jgi:hypothetical protein
VTETLRLVLRLRFLSDSQFYVVRRPFVIAHAREKQNNKWKIG